MSQLVTDAESRSAQPEVIPLHRSERLVFLPFSRIRPFAGHLFHLYAGERLDDMVSSIAQNGILMPLIVRRLDSDSDDDYEMLSGHNRMNAGMLAGLEGALCLVKDGITDADAKMYVIETNLMQRGFSDMLPSEKAAVLAMQYSELFSQGKRSDIIHELELLGQGAHSEGVSTCGNGFHKLSRDTLGQEYGLTGRMVAAYVRIDALPPTFKNRLDCGEFPLMAGVSLTFLSAPEQQAVEVLLAQGAKLTKEQAKRLQAQSAAGGLDVAAIANVLMGVCKRGAASPSVKISHDTYAPYFPPQTPPKEIERVIGVALALYFSTCDKKNIGVA